MRDRSRPRWHFRTACGIAALLASATAARATPISYVLSGVGSGTVAGTPFTDAAYVIRADGDTADVTVIGGFPFPGTVVSASVTVTIAIAGVGTTVLTGAGTLANTSPDASLALTVGSPPAMLSASDLGLLGYGMQSSFGPLVLAGPPALSQVAQPSDLGAITLDSSSAVTFEVITTCGNGMLDADEQCDDGNASAADCCAPSCQFARADGASCVSTDICSAAAGTCQSGACVAGPRDCDDHVPCTQDSCDQSLGCVHVDGPAIGCLTAEKSTFLLIPGEIAGQAMVGWRWAKGAALARGDLADPTIDASYELCVYSGASGTLIGDAVLPAGAQWSAAGAKGYRFRGLMPSTVARLRSGSVGTSSAVMKGRGIDLEQMFPFAAPVTVQLRRAGAPLCLESRFEVLDRSDATKLKARTP